MNRKSKKKGSKGERRKAPKREATGHEVMKRPPPSDLTLQPVSFEFDPKKAYSVEQLAEMAAISVKWTQIEAHIDFIGSHILFTKVPLWLRISADRVISTWKKLELLQESVTNAKLLNALAKQCITDAFNDFKTYNSYRNAIVHHSIYDHKKGIGSYIDESKKPSQIMVSLEALRNFYSRICVLQIEIQQIDLLFRIETEAQIPGTVDYKTGRFEPFSPEKLREQVIPSVVSEVLLLRKQRSSLPPLPKFPDADIIRARWEALASRFDPAEKE